MEKNAKIYIAGHRGLVGSAILNNLKAKGYYNLILRTHAELDLKSSVNVESFFKSELPDYVFLAAAKVGGIVANNRYRADFLYDNLMIQNNVIHNSYKFNVKKLLFLGSTCIYPKNCPQPMKEEYLLTDTLEYTNEPYAIAKIAGIKLCESYNLQYGTNFISVMPTNLFGPNDNFDLEKSHVLPALIRKIHLGKELDNQNWERIRHDLDVLPIEGIDGTADKNTILNVLAKHGVFYSSNGSTVEIWGTGKPKREFLWSEDMADAAVFIMKHRNFKDTFKPGAKEIRNTHINIGTGSDISIADLAELIKSHIGFNGTFRYNENRPDGTPRKVTDVNKLNKFGWQHKVDLEDGIAKLYSWYLKK